MCLLANDHLLVKFIVKKPGSLLIHNMSPAFDFMLSCHLDSQDAPLNWSRIPLPNVLLLASPPPPPSSTALPLPAPSPPILLLSPSNPSPRSTFFSPTTHAGTLHCPHAAGPHSALHAVPTNHPILAASAEPGREDKANWPDRRYTRDLSLRTSPCWSLADGEDEVAIRYL